MRYTNDGMDVSIIRSTIPLKKLNGQEQTDL